MFQYIEDEMRRSEESEGMVDREAAFKSLRRLGIDDFGQILMIMPEASKYPTLSKLLPAMASVETQRAWTGSDGLTLLSQTCSFVRSICYNYYRVTGHTFDNVNVLDYGCGWGRIARLMYYFTPETKVFGVDPWDKSIGECRTAGLLSDNFIQSDYLPTSLPLGDRKFEVVYSFSVFTHLSKRATLAAAKVLRNYIRQDGLLVITVRPIEYWNLTEHLIGIEGIKTQQKAHLETGFAFVGHQRQSVDGDVTYGETSMSFQWVKENFTGWNIVAVDRSETDPYQIYMFLRPT